MTQVFSSEPAPGAPYRGFDMSKSPPSKICKTTYQGRFLFPILSPNSWLEFRGKPAEQGQNLTTHLALIEGPDGRQHKCYVKASPPGNPMVLAEAAGWVIAEALDLPRPEFAGLVLLPVQKLRAQLKLDQHWMRYPEILAFCSSAVPGKHVTGRWRWFSQLNVAKALKHPDVARVAAFDQWVENQDRHMGNLLRTPGGGYVPIDNEAILYALLWLAAGFTYVPHSLREQARTVLRRGAYTQFEASMILASQQHAGACQKVLPALTWLVQALVQDPAHAAALSAKMESFLVTRAHPDWLSTELGHIP